MRSAFFVLAPTVTLLVLALAAPAAVAQPQLRTREQLKQDQAKAEKEKKDKEQAAPATSAAAPAPVAAVKAGQCLPDGKVAGHGVNTFEDILAMADFGLKDLEPSGPQAEPVVWQPVDSGTR